MNYAHGFNPPPPLSEEDRKIVFMKTLRQKVMKFQDMREIASSVEEFAKQPIIKGVINWGETSAWIAPPGGMKSALLANIAVHVAAGIDWHGHKTKQRVNVIYFALERADLVRRRLVAQATRLGIDPKTLNIMVVSEMIDLMNPTVVDRVSELIEAGLHFFNPPPGWDEEDESKTPWIIGTGLVIFDTFAKLIAAGNGDEDKARDQGKVFANLQRIKNDHHCHVALIGHTGKDEARGSRGSNAIVGDVDVLVTISGSDVKTATVIKANDAPEGPICSFKSEMFEFGLDDDGDPITVNIVSGEEVSQSATVSTGKRRLSPRHQLALDALAEAVLNAGKPPAPAYGLPEGIRVVPIDRWKDELYSRSILSPDDANPRQEFKRMQDSLAARSRIGRKDGFVWLAA
jgi:hypothetical protein